MENCHFYIYSSGDEDTRWLDEYKIINGELFFAQNTIDSENYWGVLLYYLKTATQLKNEEYKKFTAFKLYEKFYWHR